jgi:carbon-monoxide dehydrogenase large subunit
VRIEPSGSVEVLMGTGSHGHSLETTIPQVVADSLGCNIDDVVLRQGGDSPYGAGTGGSRSAVIAGGAAQTAATNLREKVVALAAHSLEASPDDLEVTGSVVSVRGTPTKQVSFAELAATAYTNMAGLPTGMEPGLQASSRFQPPSPFTWSNATHLCTCEVDVETGQIDLLRYIVSEDCGVMINPMVVEGQIVGGVIHGVGNAFFERLIYDDQAQPVSTHFGEYLLPLATDSPTVEVLHMETPSPLNPLGLKGAGEGGTIAAIAALLSAVENALEPFGVHIAEAPITPQRIVELLGEHALGRTR